MISMPQNLKYIMALQNKLPDMIFDVNNQQLRITNESHAKVVASFTIDDIKTIGLRKRLTGEDPDADVSLTNFAVPSFVQKNLTLFGNTLSIYIKSRKIILSGGNITAVIPKEVAQIE